MIHRPAPGSTRRPTLGADKGHDSADFVAEPRQARVTPRVARKARGSAIDGRTTRRRRLGADEIAALEWLDRFNHRRLLAPIGDIPPAEVEAR